MKIPDPFQTRQSQTRIKHEILRAYAGAWAGIITTGAGGSAARAKQAGKEFTLDLAYVDLFAGAGRYGRDADQKEEAGTPIWGSPIIATQMIEATLDDRFRSRGFAARTTAVAIDKQFAAELLENSLEASLPIPVVALARARDLAYGTYTVIGADCRDCISDIVTRVQRNVFVLALIDPYGETMRLSDLKPLICHPHADAIALFPVMEVDKHAGSALKAPSQRSQVENTNLERTTDHFGTAEWMEIPRNVGAGPDRLPEREEAYAELYARQLSSLDPSLAVKKIGLRLSKIDRTGYHLFLTTRHPDGAFRMNDILRRAGISEYWAVWADQQERLRAGEESQGVLSFDFGDQLRPPSPPSNDVPIAMVKAAVMRAIGSAKVIEFHELRMRLANDVFTSGEFSRAMTALRKDGKLNFPDQNPRTSISIST